MKLRARGPRSLAAVIAVLALVATLTPARPALAVASGTNAVFDVDAPFTLVSNDGQGDPHIDTVDGMPPTPVERAAVEDALDRRIVEPPSHMAYATAGANYFWRGGADDLDVHLRVLSTIPDEAVDVIKSVFEDLQDTIDMGLPDELWHEIDVHWDTSLPNGVLAGASTWWVTVNQNGADFRIPVALYEILGGPQPTNNAPAMSITINANALWDMALQPSDQGIDAYYLKTVLLHEVTHGLGFTSGVSELGSINTATPTPWSARIYGQQNLGLPLDTHGTSIVRSDNVWLSNTDGTWSRLFDPPQWQNGSSLSHLDETAHPYAPGAPVTPGALMTPFIQRGETSTMDGVVVGVLAAIGYTTLMAPLPPTVAATTDDATATITIDPSPAGAFNVPAETWTVALFDSGNASIAQQTVAATERAVTFTGLAPASSYTAVVVATTDGNTNQTSVQFATAPSASTPSTTPPSSTTTDTIAPRPPTTPAVTDSMTSTCLIRGNADPFDLDSEARASIFRLYCAYFLRLPDAGGFAYWVGEHNAGTDLRRISDFFADSDEFDARYGRLTNQQYVRLTYLNVLEREPDAGGFAYWVSRLESGLTRGDLTLMFSDSPEFRERTHSS